MLQLRRRARRRLLLRAKSVACLLSQLQAGEAAVALHEGAEAGDGLADDQILHLISAFVGVERLGIGEEARDVVVGDDTVAAQQFAGPGDRLARLSAVQNALASAA